MACQTKAGERVAEIPECAGQAVMWYHSVAGALQAAGIGASVTPDTLTLSSGNPRTPVTFLRR